jgi:ABC-type antimicrobial peptide transport system permease subunit
MLGLALGLHAAYGMNRMTVAIWGYQPDWTIPWDLVVPGIAFTVGVCLVAGTIPARRAARNNVIDALQTV